MQVPDDRVHGHLARHFAGGRATHAVAHDEQAFVGAQHVGVLVERADTSGVGARAYPQPHGSFTYKDCAG